LTPAVRVSLRAAGSAVAFASTGEVRVGGGGGVSRGAGTRSALAAACWSKVRSTPDGDVTLLG
jgi:hypothetical protein